MVRRNDKNIQEKNSGKNEGKNIDMREKILQWFAAGRVGASSKAMACCLIGAETDGDHPFDPSDLNRCLLFLEAVPEARLHLDKFRAMSDTWNLLIEKERSVIFI